MVFVPGDILMSFQNVRKIRALSVVYTNTYDYGAVLHCFMGFFWDSTKCGAGRICGADLNGDNLRILRLRISDKRRILISK